MIKVVLLKRKYKICDRLSKSITMSLTTMLSGSRPEEKEFQAIIKEHLPQKQLFKTNSDYSPFTAYEVMAPYFFTNQHYSSVSGTAFDYLARAIIARKITNNKEGAYGKMVARNGLEIFKRFSDEKQYALVKDRFEKDLDLFKKFIHDNGTSLEDIIPCTCRFARLDSIFRAGLPPDDPNILLRDEISEIKEDLRNLCAVFEENFIPNAIETDSVVIFNPTFGLMSNAVRGADGDVFIDGTLFDFKTSKLTGYKWQDAAQLWGYYLLDEISKAVEDESASIKEWAITRLAFYRARYGIIEYLDIEDITENAIEDTLTKLAKFFWPE